MEDNTWEDMRCPEGCVKAVGIMAVLRENGITGLFRVVEEQEHQHAETKVFEVRETKTYEVVDFSNRS